MAAPKTALLVLDFHNQILNMIQDQETKDKVVASVSELIKVARENGTPIIHGLIDVKRNPSHNSKMKERWATGFKPLIEANPEAMGEYSAFLAPEGASNEETVTRTPGMVSALKSDNVQEILKKWGVERLVISGISTSGCVNSTTREATDLNFVTTVVKDACWDPVPEAHKVLCETVFPMTAHVVEQQKGLELLRGGDL